MRIYPKLVIAILVMALIPLAIVNLAANITAGQAFQTEIFAKLQVALKYKAAKVDDYFTAQKAVLSVFKDSPVIKFYLPVLSSAAAGGNEPSRQGATRSLDAQFARYQSGGLYAGFLLLDTHGVVVYASADETEAAFLAMPLPGFNPSQFGKSEQEPYLSDIVAFDQAHPFTLFLVDKVRDAAGQAIGAAAIAVDLTVVYRDMEDRTGLGESGETLLAKKISETSMVYISPLRHDPDALLKKEIPFGSPLGIPAQEATRGKSGEDFWLDYRSVPVLSAWQYLPAQGWGMVAKVDAAEVMAPITGFHVLTIGLSVAMLSVIAVVALFLARLITFPIRALRRGTEIIGAGDLQHRVGTATKDEIGQLSRDFDGMVERIRLVTASREELDAAKRDLERSNKELEEFAYLASHDLKSPLQAIESLSQWLEEDLAAVLTPGSRNHLELLHKRVQRMKRLLDDLLEYSRIGRVAQDIKPCDTALIVEQVCEILNIPPEFNVAIRRPLPVFQTAVTPLRRVFHNLICNAIKHHDRPTGTVTVWARDRGERYEFGVEDDGPGIAPEFHERVFGMFQTLKPRDQVEGSGIGLAVVKKIVEQFGGQIRLESGPGRGTLFSWTWPKTPAEFIKGGQAR